jgi:hypothetical protein
MIAKNIGIRRARGEFVITTNPGIIFSSELVQFLAGQRLERRRIYHVDDYDVAGEVPALPVVEELLRYCKKHAFPVGAPREHGETGLDSPRTAVKNDIAAPGMGIRLGPGWYSIDRRQSEIFRWIGSEATLLLDRPGWVAPRLFIDAETGPSAGGEPLVVEVVDQADRTIASARIGGRCKFRLHMPDWTSTLTLRLRTRGGDVPLARDPRFLNLRVFGIWWEGSPWWLGPYFPSANPPGWDTGVYVRSIEPRQIQLAVRTEQGSSLERLQVNLSDPEGNVLFHVEERIPPAQVSEYRLSLDLGLQARAYGPEQAADTDWSLEVTGAKSATDWTTSFYAPSPFAGQMHNPACLHTNGCDGFTMLSRDDWFALRGYPELSVKGPHMELLLSYVAHHAGISEVVLREPMCSFRIGHFSGDGRVPEEVTEGTGEIDAMNWIDRMRRLGAPAIFNRANWGLAEVALAEKTL